MTQKNVVGIITTIQWNYDNKPTSITRDSTTVSFTYDGNGQRVKKTAPNLTVFYFGEGYEKRGGVGIIHLFAGNQRIASVRSDGTQYYHPDHLGSSWIVTDGNGAIKEKNEFYPFGTYLDSFTSYPFPAANYTFTGKEEDDEVGLYNYNARLYDPVLGRFISPDSIVQAPEDPQSLNHYSYVRNNPLKYIDPTGNQDEDSYDFSYSDYFGYYNEETLNEPFMVAKNESIIEPPPQLPPEITPSPPSLDDMLGFPNIFDKIIGFVRGLWNSAFGGLSTTPSDKNTQKTIEEASKNLVIGKMKDLVKEGTLKPGERMLDLPNKGTPKDNWAQNASRIREAMKQGSPIRDASVDPKTGALRDNTGFLRSERDLLQNNDWFYDPDTRYWYPPIK